MRYVDKLLPDQAPLSDLFAGPSSGYTEALFQSIVRSCGIPPTEDRFRLSLSDKFSIAEMGSSPIQLRILEFMVRLSRAKSALEIGTFIGVSSMAIASALPLDGHLVTIEKFDHFAAIARENFTANGFDRKIELIEGDAAGVIAGFNDDTSFDFVFIDGNKERYPDYFEAACEYLSPGGLIVVDDVFFHGDAVNDHPSSEKGRGVKAFLDTVSKRDDFFKATITIANGLMLLQHRSS